MKIIDLLKENKSDVVYHGTTDKVWEKIKKLGKMTPQATPDSYYRGNDSELPHTKDQLYFAKDRGMASGYAKDQEEHSGSAAIILSVPTSALDLTKCYPDDEDFAILVGNKHKISDSEAKKMMAKDSPEAKTAIDTIVKEWRAKFSFNTEFGYRGSVDLKHITVVS